MIPPTYPATLQWSAHHRHPIGVCTRAIRRYRPYHSFCVAAAENASADYESTVSRFCDQKQTASNAAMDPRGHTGEDLRDKEEQKPMRQRGSWRI